MNSYLLVFSGLSEIHKKAFPFFREGFFDTPSVLNLQRLPQHLGAKRTIGMPFKRFLHFLSQANCVPEHRIRGPFQ